MQSKSRPSGPAITWRVMAASVTSRVSGPTVTVGFIRIRKAGL